MDSEMNRQRGYGTDSASRQAQPPSPYLLTHRANKNSGLFLTFIQSIFKGKKKKDTEDRESSILAPHVPGHQEKKPLSFATTYISNTLSVGQRWSLRRHRCVMRINRPQISLWKIGHWVECLLGSLPHLKTQHSDHRSFNLPFISSVGPRMSIGVQLKQKDRGL